MKKVKIDVNSAYRHDLSSIRFLQSAKYIELTLVSISLKNLHCSAFFSYCKPTNY